jgi:hypothetical protein
MSLKEQFGKDVLLTGWGHSRFGKLTDETLESLIVQVATEAIGNAGIEPGQIDEIYLGQFNSGMMPLAFPSSLALQVSDQLANVPATRVENACASGSAAFQQGTKSLLAGTAKTVLVIGAEKMTQAGADVVGAALLGADYDMAGKTSTTGFTGLFADVAKHYEKRYGPVSDILGTIAAKNHRNGVDNPYAQLRKDLGEEFCRTVSDKNPMVADPLRRTDCSPVSDGAAAVILSTSPDVGGHRPGPARRLRPRERLLPRRTPRPDGLRRHPRILAARPGDGRRRTSGPGLRGGARLLHHRRTADVRGHGTDRTREGKPGGRGRPGVQGRETARQRLRRPQSQGPPSGRHRRVPARHRRHAAHRHRRRHAAGHPPPRRCPEHGRRGHRELRQRPRSGLTGSGVPDRRQTPKRGEHLISRKPLQSRSGMTMLHYRKDSGWNDYATIGADRPGVSVQIRRKGRLIRAGIVEESTADSTILWIADGLFQRMLVDTAEDYEVWEPPASHAVRPLPKYLPPIG